MDALNTQATIESNREIRAAWDRIASGYDRYITPTHLWLGHEGLQRVGLRAGERFLDVAAGSGALSLPAARLGAQVLATDLSPSMLERLQARAREEGLSNLRTQVMDGHALQIDDDVFDVAGSQFGVMLFPDMPRGLAEMVRVTRPGGRVLMNVFGRMEEVEFFTMFVAAIGSVVPGFSGPPQPPLPFQLQDPAKLRAEMGRAGLTQIRIETITERLECASGEQLWSWLTNSNPVVGDVLASLRLDDDRLARVRDALERMVDDRRQPSGNAVLTNPIHIGTGIKPARG
ncbi:MAG TPA: methyltransferase domain-containing protein [Burkholderiaceae bacterium]|nr:methyltransferase domain-containing protein [Burkholderiaceae bacterium]